MTTIDDKVKIETHIAQLEKILQNIEKNHSDDIEALLDDIDKAINIIEKCDKKMKKIELRVTEIKQRLEINTEEADD